MKIRFSVSTNIVHYFHNLKMMNFNFEWNISQLLSWIYVLPSSKLWLIEEERQHQCSKNPSDKGRGSSPTTLPFYMMGVVMMKMVNFRNFFFSFTIVPDQWGLAQQQSKHTRPWSLRKTVSQNTCDSYPHKQRY